MSNNTFTLEQTVTLVNESVSSIFSKDDVLALLNRIAPSSGSVIDQDKLMKLLSEEVDSAINDLSSDDVVDFGTAGFSLNYNEIQLDDISLNSDTIGEKIQDALDRALNEYFSDDDCDC